MSSYEDSRTFVVEKSILEGIASTDEESRTSAIDELPDALTPKEISDVAIQLSLLPGVTSVKEGRRVETDGILHIGSTALFLKNDLVTAENAARELRGKGTLGIIGWLLIKNEIRKTKKEIINSIID